MAEVRLPNVLEVVRQGTDAGGARGVVVAVVGVHPFRLLLIV